MQALLLAAGQGTRLRPLTNHMPKCLAPVRGKPLLGIWLNYLTHAGVDKIFVNLHHHASMVEQFIRDSGFADRVELLHEKQLLGTAGTLVKYRHLYAREPLLLIHADNLSVFSFSQFYQFHQAHRHQSLLSMMTFTTDDPQSCGIVEVNPCGKLLAFHEKVDNPPGNRANAAIYWLEPELIDQLDASVSDFSLDVLPECIDKIWCWHNACYHRDIGNHTSLSAAQLDAPDTVDGPVTDAWSQQWEWIKRLQPDASY